MATFVNRSSTIDLTCAKTLNALVSVGTAEENVTVRVLHEERPPNVEGDQQQDDRLFSCVLHFQAKCISASSDMQAFSFIAFLSNKRYLCRKRRGTLMKTIFSAASFLILGVYLQAQTPAAPPVGSVAPDFALPYATKDSISRATLKLSDFSGKPVIIAFYPADWSGGCTKEVCTMRDNFAALQGLNAEILAISGDYVWSHHEWAKFHNLPFRLLSDHSHAVAKLYDSFNEKSLYNRRTIFVVDKNGKIAYENLTYSVADLQDFEKLKSALASMQ
jgi:peroxiredoxin Q/BCP